jgi:hypothetical protein
MKTATELAQQIADQELEAIIELAEASSLPEKDRYFDGLTVASLRAVRRPKPQSLKEQAFAILAGVAVCELHGDAAPDNRLSAKDIDTIRRALEALSDD